MMKITPFSLQRVSASVSGHARFHAEVIISHQLKKNQGVNGKTYFNPEKIPNKGKS
jgi:hypothetical protein